MAEDDDDYLDDADDDDGSGSGGEDMPAVEAPPASRFAAIRDWFRGKRGWISIIVLAIIQAIFATIMIALRSDAKPVREEEIKALQDLAVEMLGHEVQFKQIYQLLPAPGGRRMTVGLDIVLVLGQLPEERVEGAPHPTPEEFDVFIAAIRELEPRVRSRLNSILQRVPMDAYGRVEVLTTVKREIRDLVNDSLDALDFGKAVRPEIGKRRVTEVLLPLFVRQML